jgi:hypothetical protein
MPKQQKGVRFSAANTLGGGRYQAEFCANQYEASQLETLDNPENVPV